MNLDETLQYVLRLLMQGAKRDSYVPPQLRPYIKILDELSVGDNVVMRGDRFVPPLGLRQNLFAIAHEGHLGQSRTSKETENGLVVAWD